MCLYFFFQKKKVCCLQSIWMKKVGVKVVSLCPTAKRAGMAVNTGLTRANPSSRSRILLKALAGALPRRHAAPLLVGIFFFFFSFSERKTTFSFFQKTPPLRVPTPMITHARAQARRASVLLPRRARRRWRGGDDGRLFSRSRRVPSLLPLRAPRNVTLVNILKLFRAAALRRYPYVKEKTNLNWKSGTG